MRKLTLAFATLFLLATTGLGLLATNRGLKDATAIEEIVEMTGGELGAAAAASPMGREIQKLADNTGKMRAGAVIYGLAGLLALALLVLAFAGKETASMAALAVVATALVGTFLSPSYDLGPLAPASARQLGYVLSGLAAAGAAAAYGAATLKRRRVAA